MCPKLEADGTSPLSLCAFTKTWAGRPPFSAKGLLGAHSHNHFKAFLHTISLPEMQVDCFEANSYYSPVDIPGHGAKPKIWSFRLF